ncbi:MAG: hypothetical protein ABJF23_02790 [Bryobacteraceae bacterium]
MSWCWWFLLTAAPLLAAAPVEQLLTEVRTASFPELAHSKITVRPLRGNSVFFAAQFRVVPFLFGARMRYVIRANPKAAGASDEALRAVLAHELSHVVYYARGKRVRLLGLVRLVSGSYRSRFERGTDLEAIRRGYGEGLKQYREWLYSVVPLKSLAGKKKDYLSPEEIAEAMKH